MSTQDPSERPPSRRTSERRQADRALRECEERYRALFDSIDCVYLHDFEGRFLDANLATLELLGYQYHEMLNLSFSSLLDDDQRAKASGVLAELRQTGSQKTLTEFRLRRKTGEYADVETRASVVLRRGLPYAVLGIGHDITERKQVEASLEKTRKELAATKRAEDAAREYAESIINTVREPVIALDQDLRVVTVSRSFQEFFQKDPVETRGQLIYDLGNKQWDIPKLRELLETILPQGAIFDGYKVEHDFSAIGRRTMLLNARQIEQGLGKERIILLAIEDITEREQIEEALRESEERHRRLFETMTQGVIYRGANGAIVSANPAAERILGLSLDQMMGRTSSDPGWETTREDGSDFPGNEHPAMVALRTGEPVYGVIMAVRSSVESKRRWITVDAIPQFLPGETAPSSVYTTFTDITERKQGEEALRQSEEELRQSQKMEAVGQLAGGIAHDFNNLLTAILGYSDMILASGASSLDEVRPDIEEIKLAGERASVLTKQILAFSRRQALRPTVVSLNEVIAGVEPLLRRTLGENIDLVSFQGPDLGNVEADVHQFEQVIMNLAVNARDAMVSGGRLTLETANVELGEEYCRTHPEVVPGSYIMLSVSDTGVGMDEATCERVFEPFFTTKAPGQGTGLGLATVYGIVRQSHGSISVYSEPSKGTSFKVYLPLAAQSGIPAEIVIPPCESARGSETVMVVEDEAALRSLVERILGGAGYTTLAFGTAIEALGALERGEYPIDLLLTDVMLSGALQGDDLARAVRAARPDLSILFMSGYPRNAVVHAGRLDEGVNFLEKPFTPEALVTTVRTVLDRPRGSG